MTKNRLLQLVYLLLLTVIALASCAAEKVDLCSKYTIVYKTITNVEPNLLSLDIYPLNVENKTPVIIWVHGGGWSGGDKRNNINNKIKLFRSLGYAFVSLNYRLSSDTAAGAKVKFPDHINDVADAVAWVYKNINLYNGDKNNIAIMGHSAGAQLVALLATDSRYLNQRGI